MGNDSEARKGGHMPETKSAELTARLDALENKLWTRSYLM